MTGVVKKSRFRRLLYIFLSLPVLLASCDIMGGSITDFIDDNTGTASVRTCDITSVLNEEVVKTKTAWMHATTSKGANSSPFGIIELKVILNNPHNYDLAITPVIYEYIGPDGIKIYRNCPIPIACISNTSNIALIRIGSTDVNVNRGDSFRIRLDLATSDGLRVFPSYTETHQIIYDTVLKSARLLPFEKAAPDDPENPYKFLARWKIQSRNEHVGINKISISFKRRSDGSEWKGDYTFLLQDNSDWINDNPYAERWFTNLITSGSEKNEFSMTFPFILDSDTPAESIADIIEDFQIFLEDKNGLNIIAGRQGSTETYLDDLHINYTLRGRSIPESSGWGDFKENKDKLAYSFIVPFQVEGVIFNADTNNEIFGFQEVRWSGSQHEPEKYFSLAVGVTEIEMEVYWKNPNWDGQSQEDEAKFQRYTFTITRLSPNRDSTLKRIIVQDASETNDDAPEKTYPFVDGFIAPPENPDFQENVKTHYTVYVPSTINNVKIMGDFLNTSEIYNEKGRTTGKPNLGSPYPKPGDLIDENNPLYSNRDYFDINRLQIKRDGWSYSVQPGVNNFYINVKPEVDMDESMTRRYIITVIKTDPNGNRYANLNDITVKAKPNGLPDTTLLEPGLAANPFSQDILNYTVYLPNSLVNADNAVTLSATTIPGAKIREVTSVNLTTNSGDLLNYIPQTLGDDSQKLDINIPFGSGVTKKRVTLTIYSTVDSTPKNYTITLIRCLPKLASAPALKGADRSLEVTLPGASSGYDICFNPVDGNPAIPEIAVKWPGDPFNSASATALITGLTNYKKYNVWVRTKTDAAGRPGEWTAADNSGNCGIPGPAIMSALTYTLTSAYTALPHALAPNFSSPIDEYTLTVPGETTAINFTYKVPNAQGDIIPNDRTVSAPAAGTGRQEIINVTSPDGKTPKDYKINIFRLLPKPPWAGDPVTYDLDGEVRLNWIPTENGLTHEIYYYTSDIYDISDPNNPEKIAGTASKWTGPINNAAGTASIAPLDNAKNYWFWVRGVKGGVPGEWSVSTQAMPKSTVNTLKGLTINNGGVFSPGFSPTHDTYTITFPSGGAGSINATLVPVKEYTQQNVEFSPSENISLNQGDKKEVTITVTPHSGVSREYKITIQRKLPAPASMGLIAQSASIKADNWARVEAADYYDIYYGVSVNFSVDDFAGAGKWPVSVSQPVSGNVQGPTITGLTNGTEYRVWIVPQKNNGTAGDYITSTAKPGDGNSSITISFGLPENLPDTYKITLSSAAALQWNLGSASKLTATAPTDADISDYQWYIDGAPAAHQAGVISINGNILTIENARALSVNKHHITAVFTYKGQARSLTIEFEVK